MHQRRTRPSRRESTAIHRGNHVDTDGKPRRREPATQDPYMEAALALLQQQRATTHATLFRTNTNSATPSSPMHIDGDEAGFDDTMPDEPDNEPEIEEEFDIEAELAELGPEFIRNFGSILSSFDPVPSVAEPKTWHDKRANHLSDCDAVVPLLIPAVACLETLDLLAPGRCCSIDGCAEPPVFRCFSCVMSSFQKTHFCSAHASLHRYNNLCHRVKNRADELPPTHTTASGNTVFKKIMCCDGARGHGRRAQFHSLTGTEIVQLVYCPNHSDGQEMCVVLVRDYGFFPSRVRNTDHAFSYQLVSLGLTLRQLGVAFLISAEAFFGTSLKDPKASGLYQPFMDAVRQLAIVKHHLHHGTFSPEIVTELGIGQSQCPACIGGDDVQGPAAFTMDGFESASKKSVERGGGTSHGTHGFTDVYFKTPTVPDVVANRAASKVSGSGGKGSRVGTQIGCDAVHKAGAESVTKSTGKDVDMIVHVDCAAHSIVHRVYDVKGGERLWYADDVLHWGVTEFVKRGFILGYDVACKELSHLLFYDLFFPIIGLMLLILFIPAMHVYAHGKDCQCLFSPRFLMGLGLTMDGEGHERVNSWLSRMIGLTQRETWENRRMDIVLFLEWYNQMKIRRLVDWTEEKLVATFAGLAEVKAALGSQWPKVEEAVYEVVVTGVTRERRKLVEKAKEGALTSKEDLRQQIDHLARSVVAIDKHLKSAPGTKMVSRLRKALASTFISIHKKLDEFNELQPKEATPLTFAVVKKDLTMLGTGRAAADAREVRDLVTLYFRYCEDLFHHKNYLNNLQGYYRKRLEVHWDRVRATVGKLSDCRAAEALLTIVDRRIKVEAEYSRKAKETLHLFGDDENALLYFDKHIDQIQQAFSSKESALSLQNLRDAQLRK
ncbi:hypothetical protein BCR33DRAFT_844770 [Rhizoclosmatium globosum]|uniref:CxC2-like cysteine cluster KDZ transposase-associated domain-containing protein n=1 Tax=Rhizoclosmatium globosum TaxID=329046 RepID=A0A1Y2D2C4_9FUNG|nr:hypothetical protein BCR33DRAFT_844770 [Rhizoclosmatium globosum]|eukprot:ORY53443.1 hypothetical protein BCR33DRAFT_844770 [Rhizoclosmatium globosum]